MAYEMRDNSGTLFRNTKPRNEKSPQFTGKALIDGKMRFFDAWEKKDKNGNTYFSCSFKTMDSAKEEHKPAQTQSGGGSFDDEIPFASVKYTCWS